MNALQLYNYREIHEQKKEFSLPPQKKIKTVKKVVLTTVNYICYNCNKQIELKLSDNIKCYHCENRVLRKQKHSQSQTYNSI